VKPRHMLRIFADRNVNHSGLKNGKITRTSPASIFNLNIGVRAVDGATVVRYIFSQDTNVLKRSTIVNHVHSLHFR
jgi:hypothetical protein